MTDHRDALVGRAFVELADTFVSDFDLVDLFHTLCLRCVELLEVDAAGLLFSDQRGGLRALGASSEEARVLHLLEIQNESGPCLDSLRTGEIITVRLEETDQWPEFSRRAIETGFQGALAVPMRLRDERIGALNLFRRNPEPLGEDALALAQAMADVATIGMLQERAVRESQILAEQLQGALNSRVLIEQAKGVLAERLGVDMENAFVTMRRHARSTSTRLGDVAQRVITGDIDIDDMQRSQ